MYAQDISPVSNRNQSLVCLIWSIYNANEQPELTVDSMIHDADMSPRQNIISVVDAMYMTKTYRQGVDGKVHATSRLEGACITSIRLG